MNEIEIQRHSFEIAKERLKEFSVKTEGELKLDQVPTESGLFGLFNHNVTGEELNKSLESIQSHFIAFNTTNNKVIKELGNIYNVFDTLDKEYITSIVTMIKGIEKTSNDVRMQQGILTQHNTKLDNQQSKLNAHQSEIEKNVVNISKIVSALNIFKEKLEGYKHLTDIDKIWNDYKTIQNEIQVLSDSITKFSEKATEDIVAANNKNKTLSDQANREILTLRDEAQSFKEFVFDLSKKFECTADLLNKQIPVIQETSSFAKQFKNITHIDDVDSMWAYINEAKENFNTIKNSFQNIDKNILKMQKHVDEIDSFVAILDGYTHLQDIDNMWDVLDIVKKKIRKTNEVIKENKKNIQMHQNLLDILATTSTEHKESIDILFKKLATTDEYALNSRNFITELESFRTRLSALNHLMEVDEIWKQMKDFQFRIKRVEQDGKSQTDELNELAQADYRMRESIDTNTHDINSLKEYKDKLSSISHLDDVDGIWKDVEEHTSQFIEGEKRDKELAATIQKNKYEVDKNIAEAVQITNTVIKSLTKKVTYAYWIAGFSAGLAIIELSLCFMKVI